MLQNMHTWIYFDPPNVLIAGHTFSESINNNKWRRFLKSQHIRRWWVIVGLILSNLTDNNLPESNHRHHKYCIPIHKYFACRARSILVLWSSLSCIQFPMMLYSIRNTLCIGPRMCARISILRTVLSPSTNKLRWMLFSVFFFVFNS